MSEDPKFVIAMVQGQTLILMCDGQQATLSVGSSFYAADIAAAINTVTSDTMEEQAEADSSSTP